ncbi:hypothetical protein CEXT_747421 [Caerostris extrusa]|uniref:Uncharacterized protein n=1 Tax=Caerostris extrusa TaxID=172846 RepID=A0AAV4S5E7_CAEEX|nr:hypothetical protein CEXT_747421 [Caerostris extrusa]
MGIKKKKMKSKKERWRDSQIINSTAAEKDIANDWKANEAAPPQHGGKGFSIDGSGHLEASISRIFLLVPVSTSHREGKEVARIQGGMNQIINSTAAEKDIANDWTRTRPHLHNMEEKGFPLMDQDILRHRSPESSSSSPLVPLTKMGRGWHESKGG